MEITDYVKIHEVDEKILDLYINHYLITYNEEGKKNINITRFELHNVMQVILTVMNKKNNSGTKLQKNLSTATMKKNFH